MVEVAAARATALAAEKNFAVSSTVFEVWLYAVHQASIPDAWEDKAISELSAFSMLRFSTHLPSAKPRSEKKNMTPANMLICNDEICIFLLVG